MTTEGPGTAWHARYPDLAGKVAVVAGTSSVLGAVMRHLGRNGVACALVANDRELVTGATDEADRQGIASLGIVADAGLRETWQRVAPHIEQRLGPIDIAVVIAPPDTRLLIASALMPDMAARSRGVIVEAGTDVGVGVGVTVPDGLRHRSVTAGAGARQGDIAAAIELCVSDVLTDLEVRITIG
jgi:hypothetical protein